MNDGERQVAPTLSGIRHDHVARYTWAARDLGPRPRDVLDVACGIGYGSFVLANHGHKVHGLDRDAEAIAYGGNFYRHERVSLRCADIDALAGYDTGGFDAAVCFEAIEHIENPVPMLREIARLTGVLYASVPNEKVFPYRGYKYHFRHYTREQFRDLLAEAGWRVTAWFGQAGPDSDVVPAIEGRTLVVRAERSTVDAARLPPPFEDRPWEVGAGDVPMPEPKAGLGHVVILGLGPSLATYVDVVKRLGGRHAFADEVWAINALGDVVACDRVFHMDDIRIQETRAASNPDGNIAAMVAWLRRHEGPVYTSRAYPEYPGFVEYPIEEVINDLGYCYFNNTAAWAIAKAIHEGASKISLFGIDFSYAHSHDAEKGRGCCEFWLGVAAARGIEIAIAEASSLMDTCEPEETKLYGYGRFGTRDVTIRQGPDGAATVSFAERPSLPSAAEIEAAYDHSRPTVPAHRRTD